MSPPSSPEPPTRYSIDDLAERAGVTRRAVRYYVQRGLLAPPIGLGRGSHYTPAHLKRLIELKEAQRAGRSLDELASVWASPAPEAASRSPLLSPPLSAGVVSAAPHTLDTSEGTPIAYMERRVHVRCADGVELSVRSGVLNIDEIMQLVSVIQRHLVTHSTHP